MHHHEHSDEELLSHPAAAAFPLCARAYKLLQKMARDEIIFDSPEFTTAWQGIKNEFNTMKPLYSYVGSLLNRNKAVSRENRKIAKSLPWRLIYPLRLVDDALRAMRKIARKRRKLAKIHG